MTTKKLFVGLTSAVALAGLVWSTSNAGTTPTLARPGKARGLDGGHQEGSPTVNAACLNPAGPCCQPCVYFEDFDNAFFVPGPIQGQGDPLDFFDTWATGCGGTVVASTVSAGTGVGGSQNLRCAWDPALATDTTLGCVVAARTPTNTNSQNNTPPVSPTTVECDVAVSAMFGSDFNIQPQARSQGFLSTRTLFFYYGSIYVLDDSGAGLTFFNIGAWDTTGGYQHLTVTQDPCANTINYTYGAGVAYAGLGGIIAGTNVDQFLVYHDNFSNAETYDVDNVRITRDPTPCPDVCGDGTVGASEQCEPTVDANCPGRCDAVTCQCTIPCGGGLPGDPCQACDVVNDVEYVEISTGGWFTWTAGAPAYAFETCGINIAGGGAYDSELSVWEGDCATGLTLIETNDDCDDNTYGYGLNADPLASCYAIGGIPSPYQSCLCVETVVGQQYYVSDNRADNSLGRRIHLLASKRLTCDAVWGDRGACCDSNGADAGCVDDVAAADCTASDEVFTKNKSCGSAEVGPCDCVPACGGLQCGDDGCGGSCGTCDDGVACTSDSCNAGQCVYTGDNALCDDGLYCNGGEVCSANGCVPGTSPCVGEEVCDEATDICAVPNPVIPTVSEWGLAIMSLLLLVGLKVYFGRREALA